MILAAGVLCWAVALCALVRAVQTAAAAPLGRGKWLWAALIAGAAALLLRPHEDIFGGQDPGSYLNSAVTYARQQSLFYTDPLLADVPQASRKDFLYGHRGFGLTKDACLWVRDLPSATLGPWFQPAYPLMMSVAARLGSPRLVLYVAPVLALMTAVALAALGRRLFPRAWMAAAVFLFYVLNPVVVWNARSPRAEWGAAFFFAAGWALILAAWAEPPGRRRWDLRLGWLCLGLAPFFHVTAWFGVLPGCAALAVAALRGRPDLLAALPAAALAGALYLAHAKWITDCYSVWRRAEPLFQHRRLLVAAGLLGWLLYLRLRRAARRRADADSAAPDSRPAASRAWRFLAAAAFCAVLAALYVARDPLGRVPFLPQASTAYVSLTNVRGWVRLTSRAAALAALAGGLCLLVRRDPKAAGSGAFLAALLPGFLFTGWMDDYMMETRRMVIFPSAAMALGLGALVSTLAAGRSCLRRPAALALCVAVLGAHVRGRVRLYRQTDYRGLYAGLAAVAEPIRARHGILLAEYSRIAAPLEHVFGIPTLSFDSEHVSDYRAAEAAWQGIMERRPGRPAFFLTPFGEPLSERFTFRPVMRRTLAFTALRASRGDVPSEVTQGRETLALYEIIPEPPRLGPSAQACGREPAPSNMGWVRFSRISQGGLTVPGVALQADETAVIALPQAVPPGGEAEILLVLHGDLSGDAPPRADAGTAPLWVPLGKSWWCYRDRVPDGRSQADVRFPQPVLLCAAFLLSERLGICAPCAIAGGAEGSLTAEPHTKRWARAQAGILFPAAASPRPVVLLLMNPERDDPAAEVRCRMWSDAGGGAEVAASVRSEWRWQAFPLFRCGRIEQPAWVWLTTEPVWDPQKGNYPPDLAIRVAYAALVGSAPASEPSGR